MLSCGLVYKWIDGLSHNDKIRSKHWIINLSCDFFQINMGKILKSRQESLPCFGFEIMSKWQYAYAAFISRTPLIRH